MLTGYPAMVSSKAGPRGHRERLGGYLGDHFETPLSFSGRDPVNSTHRQQNAQSKSLP
jgi:hypothetical protein